MTRFERAFVWVGGGLFVGSLLFWTWWYARQLGQPRPWNGWTAVALDAALFGVFAAHHSVFARETIKCRLTAIPARLQRSVYVWIASALFIAVALLWQPVGGEVYEVHGPGAAALLLVQLCGVWVIARAVSRIDPLELSGIRDASSSSAGTAGLQVTGPYRWVRHPVYFGWILVVFGAAHMTGDRLAFASISTIYLAAAVPWEERSLLRAFGDEYARYTRQVRWRMLPYVY